MELFAFSFGTFGWGIIIGLVGGAVAAAGISKLRDLISKA